MKYKTKTKGQTTMIANRSTHRPTVAFHTHNIQKYLGQMLPEEKSRLIQIDTEWTLKRTLTMIGKLDEGQRDFIDFIADSQTVAQILEHLGMRRYQQLLRFLEKLDATLIETGTHPAEVYFVNAALRGRQTVTQHFSLTTNFAYVMQFQIADPSRDPLSLTMNAFAAMCGEANIADPCEDYMLFTNVHRRVDGFLELKNYPELPNAAIRREIAIQIVSALAKALTEELSKDSPQFSIPTKTIEAFTQTFADEFVFRALFVRTRQ